MKNNNNITYYNRYVLKYIYKKNVPRTKHKSHHTNYIHISYKHRNDEINYK